VLVFMYGTPYFCQIVLNINFLDISQKILKWQILWKSIQWEPSCSMQTDRQSMLKLIFAFRNFANAP